MTTLWFWGFWGSLAPHLVGKYIIPGSRIECVVFRGFKSVFRQKRRSSWWSFWGVIFFPRGLLTLSDTVLFCFDGLNSLGLSNAHPWKKGPVYFQALLLMEEVLHLLRLVVYPTILRVLQDLFHQKYVIFLEGNKVCGWATHLKNMPVKLDHLFRDRDHQLVPGKLTWQWKNNQLKMYLLLEMVIFRCHVSSVQNPYTYDIGFLLIGSYSSVCWLVPIRWVIPSITQPTRVLNSGISMD